MQECYRQGQLLQFGLLRHYHSKSSLLKSDSQDARKIVFWQRPSASVPSALLVSTNLQHLSLKAAQCIWSFSLTFELLLVDQMHWIAHNQPVPAMLHYTQFLNLSF